MSDEARRAASDRATREESRQPFFAPRSMLFVPADSERKLDKARDTAADALILDLEDSVDGVRKARARSAARAFLEAERKTGQMLWVRINPLDDAESRADLDAVLGGRPDGLVLPKVRTADDVALLATLLDALEQRAGAPPGSTRILPIATETPSGVFALGRYTSAGPRLAALTWGAEDLSTALGAETAVDAEGDWLAPYQLVRSLCLLAAADAGVAAIDTVHTDLRDERTLARQTRAAKRDGFAGKLAIHPAQVAVLNEIFTPTRDEIERARSIVDAFAASPDTGVVSLDGRMLDRPHLLRARRLLARAQGIDAAGADRDVTPLRRRTERGTDTSDD